MEKIETDYNCLFYKKVFQSSFLLFATFDIHNAFREISHCLIRSCELVIFRKILAITSSSGGGVGKRFFKGLKIF